MLILASKSPRRKELIAHLGIPFRICPGNSSEELNGSPSAEEAVKILSKRKAEDVFVLYPEDLILGVDTVVYCAGKILGKPKDPAEARAMLTLLSGKTHTVYSGFTLLSKDKSYSEAVATKVTFAPVSEEEMDRYIDSGEPFDKAGGYGIQGQAALFICGIEGDYPSVVGLPLHRIYRALRDEFGVDFKTIPHNSDGVVAPPDLSSDNTKSCRQ